MLCRLRSLAVALAVSGFALTGCPDDPPSDPPVGADIDASVNIDSGSDETPTPDAAPDATPDATPDAEPDATPDAEPDATPDAEPDATPDAEPDAQPDATPDAQPDGIAPGNTIVDIIVDGADTNLLEAAVIQAGLQTALAGPGPFTVFAPTDTAIQRLIDTLNAAGATYDQDGDGDFDANDLLALPNLADILGFHVHSGSVNADTIIAAGSGVVSTLEGADLPYQVRAGTVYVQGGTSVTEADIVADNGIIHKVDSVVFAPGDFPGNVVERLQIAPGFDSLVGAAVAAQLGGNPVAAALTGDGPFTVFAPHNEAFGDLTNPPSGGELTDTLLYHVVPANADSAAVLGSTIHPTLLNNGAPIKVDADAVTIGGAAISTVDITASNGTIHVVDSVIAAPGDIVDVATGDGNFGALLGLLTDASLASTFVDDTAGDQSADLYTVFAPTDAAFTAMAEAFGLDASSPSLYADLNTALGATWTMDQVLLHHVTAGVVDASAVVAAITDGTNPDSLVSSTDHSTSIELDLLAGDAGPVVALMGYAQVTVTDIVTRNGIIHVIDTPMFPTNTTANRDYPGTLAQLVLAAPLFSTLEVAVTDADAAGAAAGVLGDAGQNLTLFAPSNAAFDKVPEAVLTSVLDDGALLQNLLWFHALPFLADSAAAAAAAGTSLTTAVDALGDPSTYNPALDVVFNDPNLELAPTATGTNATIVRTDIRTANGWMHIIDEVLLPGSANPPTTNTITDIVVNSPNTTLLEAAVIQAGLAGALAGPGPFTVFAPSDTAIQRLIDTLNAAGATYDQDNDGDFDAADLLALPNLGDILGFHVHSGNVSANDIVTAGNGAVSTLEGSNLSYQVRAGAVYIQGGTSVTNPDIVADNGVIHIVDSVVFAPGDFPGNVVERLQIAPGFDSLVGATVAAQLGGNPVAAALTADGPFTVFAPHNEAFAALTNPPSGGALTDTLLYHVVPANAGSAAVLGSAIHPTLLNNGAPIKVDADAVTIGGAAISTVDITASNGTIHVVDSVIAAPGDIVDVATDAGNFGALLNLLTDANLAGTFVDGTAGDQSADLYTVFAPTDAAFTALAGALGLDASSPTLYADLNTALGATWTMDQVLLHHVTAGVVDSGAVAGAVADGTNPDSLVSSADHSTSIELDVLAGDFGPIVALMGYAQVTITDIPTRNGIIHVIDTPMFPTNTAASRDYPGTLAQLVLAAPIFGTLEAAVTDPDAAGAAAGVLGDPGQDLTLFAPSNAAFNKVDGATLNAVLDNPALLQNLLWFHALPILADSTAAAGAAGTSLTTALDALGDPTAFNPALNVIFNDPNLELAPTATGTNATIVRTDIRTANGWMHVIDEVLLPTAVTPPGSNTITDIVVDRADTTLLEAALVATGLNANLAAPGEFTLFAPSDTAIQRLIDTLNAAGATYDQDGDGDFDANDLLALPNLADILLFHVHGNDQPASTFINNGSGVMSTLSGNFLPYEERGGNVYIQGATQVTTPDIVADNGYVHIVDSVVFAEGDFPGNIVERLQIAPGFDSLVGAAVAAQLGGNPVAAALTGDGPFTVFAPHNQAFAALTNPPSGGELTDTLLYHVVGADADSTAVLGSNVHPTLLNGGAPILVNATAGTIGGSALNVALDITASNGRIHVIDSVINAPGDIVDVATGAGTFGALLGLLTDAGLAGTFVDDTAGDQSADLYTVFAPTDAAFTALAGALGLDASSPTLYADLNTALGATWSMDQVLLHHVTAGVVNAADVGAAISGGVTPASLVSSGNHSSGIELDLLAGDAGPVVALMGYAQVTVTDIPTRNGIIHVIDTPIFPTNSSVNRDYPGTLAQLVLAAPLFSTLEVAVTDPDAAGAAAGVLGDPGQNLTLFAPSNAAFAKIDGATLNAVLDDAGLLQNILWLHALTTLADSATAAGAAGTSLTTALAALGDTATYSPDLDVIFNDPNLELSPTVTGTNATIVRTDIRTANGWLHIIDEVLLPAAAPPPTSNTITDVVVSRSDTSLLEAALVASGLDAALAAPGEFTLFAPSDTAIQRLIDTLNAAGATYDQDGDGDFDASDLLALPNLADILLYHVHGNDQPAATFITNGSGTMSTLNGDRLAYQERGGNVYIQGATQVTTPDIVADNGFVHIVDSVVFAPGDFPGNIVERLQIAPGFDSLVGAAVAAQLGGNPVAAALAGNGPFTVFAPHNQAFAALSAAPSGGELTDTLLYHVVSGNADAAAVAASNVHPTLLNGGAPILADATPGGVAAPAISGTIGGATFSSALNITASNGTIHVLDDVIATPGDIVDVATAAGTFGTLLGLLTDASLAGTFVDDTAGDQSANLYTVFAPTNAAFTAMVNALGLDPSSPTLYDDLNTALGATWSMDQVLLHHVTAGVVDANTAVTVGAAAGSATSLVSSANHSTDIELNILAGDAGNVLALMGYSQVTVTDIPTRNGIIHVIDTPIFPSNTTANRDYPGTIAQLVLAAPLFDTLEVAVTDPDAAGAAAGVLGDPGQNLTLFAPSNAAFAKIDSGALAGVLDNGPLLQNLLWFHALAFLADSAVAAGAAGTDLTTAIEALGDPSTFIPNLSVVFNDPNLELAPTVTGTNATIVRPDIRTANGWVHVIDEVLLPSALGTARQTLFDRPDTNLLEAALVATGLDAALDGPGPLTIFAPNDAGIQRLIDTLDAAGDTYDQDGDGDFDANDLLVLPNLADILGFHVHPGTVTAADAIAAGSGALATVETSDLPFQVRDGKVYIQGGTQVVIPDVPASNGVIHVVDSVVFAAGDFPGNVVERLQIAPGFDSLVNAAVAAQLAGAPVANALIGDGPFTVFAPHNEAFAALTDVPTGGALTDTLLYHVVPANADAATVLGRTIHPTLLNNGAPIDVDADNVTIGGQAISTVDITASNGTIHVVDGVIPTPGDIVEVATAAGNFDILLDFLNTANLGPTFVDATDGDQADQLLTVFAPTDAAFAAMVTALGFDASSPTLYADLDAALGPDWTMEQILLHHVTAGVVDSGGVGDAIAGGVTPDSLVSSAALEAGIELDLLAGDTGPVPVLMGYAQVVVTDIPTRNGIIHVIDTPIFPSVTSSGQDYPGTIAQLVLTAPIFGTLETAVTAGGATAIATALSDPGQDFTLFAPSNAAFNKVDPGTLANILGFGFLLRNTLWYHALTFLADSGAAAAAAGGTLTTAVDTEGSFLFNPDLNVIFNDPNLELNPTATGNNAVIVRPDIRAANGWVHMIDEVLVPNFN